MDSMRKQSEWISESKTKAANKTILTLLSIWLEETLSHSKPRHRNDYNLLPKLQYDFTYQSPTTTQADETKSHIDDQSVYEYSHLLQSEKWKSFIKDPFNKLNRDTFIKFISPDECTEGKQKKIINILGVSNNECGSCGS